MPTLLFVLAQAAAPRTSSLLQIVPFIGMFIIFYFFMIRPQQARVKKERAFREALQKGDRVVSASGLHGRIVEMEGTTVLLEVDHNVKVRMEREAILRHVATESAK